MENKKTLLVQKHIVQRLVVNQKARNLRVDGLMLHPHGVLQTPLERPEQFERTVYKCVESEKCRKRVCGCHKVNRRLYTLCVAFTILNTTTQLYNVKSSLKLLETASYNVGFKKTDS